MWRPEEWPRARHLVAPRSFEAPAAPSATDQFFVRRFEREHEDTVHWWRQFGFNDAAIHTDLVRLAADRSASAGFTRAELAQKCPALHKWGQLMIDPCPVVNVICELAFSAFNTLMRPNMTMARHDMEMSFLTIVAHPIRQQQVVQLRARLAEQGRSTLGKRSLIAYPELQLYGRLILAACDKYSLRDALMADATSSRRYKMDRKLQMRALEVARGAAAHAAREETASEMLTEVDQQQRVQSTELAHDTAFADGDAAQEAAATPHGHFLAGLARAASWKYWGGLPVKSGAFKEGLRKCAPFLLQHRSLLDQGQEGRLVKGQAEAKLGKAGNVPGADRVGWGAAMLELRRQLLLWLAPPKEKDEF